MYSDQIIQRLIQMVKYAPARDAAGAFDLVVGYFLRNGGSDLLRSIVGDQAILVPVPLHWRREAVRGFNQSEFIADALVRAGMGTFVAALRRMRATDPQVELPRDARAKNIAMAFVCEQPDAVRGRSALIIDDVITTGATVSECARALRAAGARPVWAFALAKG